MSQTIDQTAETTAPLVLVPPRPNLGPEPWSRDDSLIVGLVSILAITIVVVVAAVMRRRAKTNLPTAATALSAESGDDSPEARLLALCERVRATLVLRLGPTLRARTTEEIAADGRVAEVLEKDDLARLTELLRAGDRVKFGRKGTVGADVDALAELTTWAASLDALSRSTSPIRTSEPRPR